MSKLDLTKYGILNATEIIHNPSYEFLFEEETKAGLEGFEKGQLTELGAVNVMTGVYTGRSPKDKFFVMDDTTKNTIWWTSDEYKNDNKPVTPEAWKSIKKLAVEQLSGKRLFVVDTFCGANESSRLKIRFIMEVAWQAHFVKNMFIRPTEEELANYGEPDFVVMTASKAKVENYKELGLNSETAVVFNLTEKVQVILNTWYGGEMKKGMFSYMNYLLPLRGMASMHCSANTSMDEKETAIFFGLSGTGKTTLSTDPKRKLIGDDEHGWDKDGIFNFEGGCYAKVINLSRENEPDIYNAIRRNALLENVTVDAAGKIDFGDKSVTENTRVSYPIYHIENIVKPVSKAWRCQEGDLPLGRCFRRIASRFHPDSGADQVLLPLGLYRQAGRYRAWHHGAYAYVLRLLRSGFPLASSYEVCRGAGEENGDGGSYGLPRQYGLERYGQAHLHQGYARYYRCHPRRLHRQGSDQDYSFLRLQGADGSARCGSEYPRSARHLCRCRRVDDEGEGSGRTFHQELRQVHGQ